MIVSKRLILRALQPADYAAWLAGYQGSLDLQNDFDESKLPDEALSLAAYQALCEADEKCRTGNTFNFYAFEQVTGLFVGGSQLWDIKRGDCQRAVLGFWVLNQYWGKGFGGEIARSTVRHTFQQLQLNRLEAEILPQNTASIALCQKLGFQFEGIKKEALRVKGKFEDHALYAMVASQNILP